jgi:hypothetical protein
MSDWISLRAFFALHRIGRLPVEHTCKKQSYCLRPSVWPDRVCGSSCLQNGSHYAKNPRSNLVFKARTKLNGDAGDSSGKFSVHSKMDLALQPVPWYQPSIDAAPRRAAYRSYAQLRVEHHPSSGNAPSAATSHSDSSAGAPRCAGLRSRPSNRSSMWVAGNPIHE